MEENQEKFAEKSGGGGGGSSSGGRGPVRTICVFCGSRPGNRPSFSAAALDLGKQLVERQINLVYGGGSGGLMGLVSKAVHEGGRHVLGVIPSALLPEEVSGETLGEVKVVRDMHERKAEMAKHADAFVALPGGYGTIEELLEIITWAQLGIHNKPVGLLNVDGYYNSLLSLFDKGVEEGFIDAKARNIFVLADTASELLTRLTEARLAVEDDDDAAAAGGGEEEEKGAAAAGVKRKRS
ncbi:hypothetical protein PAHAL_9G127300 [Panicum hallii]|uniref:Cytokinin riboside 5'-monophosphate phosphoribohydrolase n=1 Tax=Panicum hallii TaxID=206008 RepID=A0A2S3IJ31_9POAL|nr:probable cytokinin riboside 5'-monophosphate phosphoribohydrolase LOG4 [Panicum hallii]PAN45557.1 hypothetical protein PAHAL_9G127300 [Panicum hallii]